MRVVHLKDDLYLVQSFVRDQDNDLDLEKTFYTFFS